MKPKNDWIFWEVEAHIILLIHTYFQPPKSPFAVKLGFTAAPVASQTTLIRTSLPGISDFNIFTV